MVDAIEEIEKGLLLPQIQQINPPTVADRVFDELQKRISSLELSPGTKLSETDVAKTMGVSRQPVREAFKRLAKLDFLLIRPQSSTTVSLVSESAILRAKFIRTALEVHTCRTACVNLGKKELKILLSILDAQREAISRDNFDEFHCLDNHFHQQICFLSGVAYTWQLIYDNKTQMDRVRLIARKPSSLQHALDEHIAILDAIVSGDTEAATRAMTHHLSHVLLLIDEIKADRHRWFTDDIS